MTEQTKTYFRQMCEEASRYEQAKAEREQEKRALIKAEDWDGVSVWNEREKQFANPFTAGQYKALRAFEESLEIQLDEIEMRDSLWEREVKDFSDTLRAAGVTAFVLTNQSTGLMEDIHNLEAQGWRQASTCKLQVKKFRFGSERIEERLGLRFEIEEKRSAEPDAETGLDPHLREAVQEVLDNLNLHARSAQTRQLCQASLNGMATALHALTGEVWTCERGADGYVFINEDKTKCLCTEL